MKGGKMQRVDGADSKLLSLRARVVQKKTCIFAQRIV